MATLSRPIKAMNLSFLFGRPFSPRTLSIPQPVDARPSPPAGELRDEPHGGLPMLQNSRTLPPQRSGGVAPASPSGDPSVESAKKAASPWCVYLIASSRIPRTYVGVTTDFPRRLRQHNGELKGGAKAAFAGRPWNLACLVEGFVNRSEACEFESKWKNISKKMGRKRSEPGIESVLQHREAALTRVEKLMDCSHLNIKWRSS